MGCEELLKQLILDKYGSVLSFSKAADIPNSTIRNIFERGFSGVGVSTALKICDMLNCDVDALLEGRFSVKKQVPANSAVNEIVMYANTMNEEGQLALLKQASYLSSQPEYKKDCCAFDMEKQA